MKLVNGSGLLPPGLSMLPPSPDGVRFLDLLGRPVALARLGDGYRSIVGLVLCLLRDLVSWEPGDEETGALGALGGDKADAQEAALTAGVVLIDEPDAHLHPSWQREIGFALQRVFPNIQFIVATHSPFVLQAASPGGITQLRLNRAENRIEAVRPVEDTVHGWHIQDIYDRALGIDTLLDPETQGQVARHAELESRRLAGSLTPEEDAELRELEAHLDRVLHAPGETPAERERYARLAELTRQLEAKVEGGGGAG